MYNIDYFRKQIFDHNNKSFNMFNDLVNGNYLYQPKIFCDEYIVDLIDRVPIFHSYYINNSFGESTILTDYDQLEYIQYFHRKNYIIVYNKDVHDIDQYKNMYKFICIDDSIIQFIRDNLNEKL